MSGKHSEKYLNYASRDLSQSKFFYARKQPDLFANKSHLHTSPPFKTDFRALFGTVNAWFCHGHHCMRTHYIVSLAPLLLYYIERPRHCSHHYIESLHHYYYCHYIESLLRHCYCHYSHHYIVHH